MVKAVFVDMDDTFLTPEKTITPENAHIMDVAYDAGVLFVPCTGRAVSGLPKQMVSHPAVRYAVCCNGAQVVDVPSRTILHEVPMNKAAVKALYEEVRDLPITFDVFSGNGIFTNAETFAVFESVKLSAPMRTFVISERTFVNKSIEQIIDEAPSITKLTTFFINEEGRNGTRAAIESHPELSYSYSTSTNYEISDAHASKGSGLEWLCEFLSIPIADTIAFGDNGNDIPMIVAAGDGVAVGNATPDVKKIADHIAPSCSESGVARYLEPLLGQAKA